jgi:hypothetical protein
MAVSVAIDMAMLCPDIIIDLPHKGFDKEKRCRVERL